jgi:hypothetical protein
MPRLGGLVADGKASKFWFAAVSDNYFTVSASGRRRARSSPAGPARRCVAVSEAQAAVDVLMTTSPTSTPRAIRASPPSWCRSRSRGHFALGPHQGPPGVNRIPHSWTLEVPRTRDPQRQAAGRLKPAPPFTRAAVVGVRGHSASLRHRRTHASSPRRNRSGR